MNPKRAGLAAVFLAASIPVLYAQVVPTEPETGAIELLIAHGPETETTPDSTPLARKALSADEFAALGTSEVINVEELNVELELVASQREVLVRRIAKWTGR